MPQWVRLNVIFGISTEIVLSTKFKSTVLQSVGRELCILNFSPLKNVGKCKSRIKVCDAGYTQCTLTCLGFWICTRTLQTIQDCLIICLKEEVKMDKTHLNYSYILDKL